MKTLGICAMLALAALGFMPVMAAGPALGNAVALAAPNSGASISDICNAVYKAVLESPAEADVVLSQVLAARQNWTAGQVYAIFRAVLLASPELESAVRSNIASYTPSPAAEAASKPMYEKVIAALYSASLPANVLQSVVNAVVNNVAGLEQMNQKAIEGHTVGGLVRDMDPVAPHGRDIPTPGPMSPQN